MRTKAETMKDLGRVLRRRVTIEKKTTGYDVSGDPTVEWQAVCSLWAERKTLYGRDYFAAVAVGEQEMIEFIVRQAPSLSEVTTDNYRLLYEGQIYDIRQIDYLDDEGMWAKVRVLRHA